jgi:hypothetical protein
MTGARSSIWCTLSNVYEKSSPQSLFFVLLDLFQDLVFLIFVFRSLVYLKILPPLPPPLHKIKDRTSLRSFVLSLLTLVLHPLTSGRLTSQFLNLSPNPSRSWLATLFLICCLLINSLAFTLDTQFPSPFDLRFAISVNDLGYDHGRKRETTCTFISSIPLCASFCPLSCQSLDPVTLPIVSST